MVFKFCTLIKRFLTEKSAIGSLDSNLSNFGNAPARGKMFSAVCVTSASAHVKESFLKLNPTSRKCQRERCFIAEKVIFF